jgi:N-acetyl-gamma-glutamyl-phosphate reductase
VRAGVFGATGYTGRELVRLLAAHPEVRLAFRTGSADGHLKHELGLEQDADAYFLALPHGISAEYAARLRRERPGAVVIDLSGDLRLATRGDYRTWYGHDHKAPELLGTAPYGLTEIYRDRVRGARLVSNPAATRRRRCLPLVPLLRLARRAGRRADRREERRHRRRAHPARGPALLRGRRRLLRVRARRAHRHVPEMEACCGERTGRTITLTFCPHLLPVKRGILSAIYAKPRRPAGMIAAALAEFYAGEPFVRVVAKPPRLSDVERTNLCLMSVHEAAPGRVVVFAALDNLVKGAAGQAIQNLNVALGLPEAAGLPVGHDAARLQGRRSRARGSGLIAPLAAESARARSACSSCTAAGGTSSAC